MRTIAFFMLPLFFLMAGCDKTADAPIAEAGISGKALYDEYCAGCHGPGGDVRNAADYDPDVPDLRTIAQRYSGRFPRVVLREVIDGRRIVQAHGSRTMPVWGAILDSSSDDSAEADARVDALVDYLVSIQTK